jgi:hypothetical protein
MFRRIPALAQTVAAVAALVFVAAGLLFSPGQRQDGETTVGERELVRVTAPGGETVEAVAILDSGATSSSIDESLAEDLGFDLANADTITVRSALGREERPVVTGGLQLAGRVSASRFTVNDRQELDTKVLIGRKDMSGLEVAVGRRLLTQPGEPRSPSTLSSILAQSPALSPVGLLALLPLAGLVIVLLRVVFGLSTLGTFSPVLLAVGYTQAGIAGGVILTVLLFALGFAAQPLLRRWRLPRVARLGVLVGVVAATLVAIQEVAGVQGAADTWGTALPVVITAVIVERLWESWDLDGARTALTEAATTVAVALLVAAILLAPVVRTAAEAAPVHMAVACTVWAGVAGTYRGLRLTELVRFAPAARAREAV